MRSTENHRNLIQFDISLFVQRTQNKQQLRMYTCTQAAARRHCLLVPELGLLAEAGGVGGVLVAAVDAVNAVVEGIAVGV